LGILFTCAIPANKVPKGKSLRLTTALHAVNSGTQGVVSFIDVDGETITSADTTAQSDEEVWNLVITNIGGTNFSIGGTSTANESTQAWGPAILNHPAVPWSTGWTLQIWVAFNTGTFTVNGDTFIVELID